MGRPNVGKSALFNRLTGSNLAIVYYFKVLTRYVIYTRAVWGATGACMCSSPCLAAGLQSFLAHAEPRGEVYT